MCREKGPRGCMGAACTDLPFFLHRDACMHSSSMQHARSLSFELSVCANGKMVTFVRQRRLPN